ncbi:cell division protein FtsW, partial [Moraxella catarrhalis]|nr:cell division protein FtsW [Moraxella catarrhalis]MPW81345.1 cell division protein FtsW [Moraxella catarrhalis]
MSQFSDKFLGFFDKLNPRTVLLTSLCFIICISLLMIASASIPFSAARDLASVRFFL